jgi:copper oxidase (laccase) domain-containing protein
MGENRFDYGKVLMIFSQYLDKLIFHISDRKEGVSPKPYDSLNLALHVGDDPKMSCKTGQFWHKIWDLIFKI